MQVRLHLVSPPWAPLRYPSAQIGALKAYVDRELGDRVETRAYSAFLTILNGFAGSRCAQVYEDTWSVGEDLYLLIYQRRYLKNQVQVSLVEQKTYLSRLDENRGGLEPLQLKHLNLLERCTLKYIDEVMVPQLSANGTNVVGFTVNFHQVYASLLIARRLQEVAPDKKFVFVFGGFTAAQPHIALLMTKLLKTGYIVVGEGELRLTAILRDLADQSAHTGKLSAPIPGVFDLSEPVDLYRRDPTLFKNQISDLNTLPLPDFHEYFEVSKNLRSNDPFLKKILIPVAPLEGTRGCFARCDFCNFPSQWDGFRRQDPQLIFERLRRIIEMYDLHLVLFVDSVCDTFAERLADELLRTKTKIHFFMELRAHHPESYWIKLNKAGMNTAQIGIEALTTPLLTGMVKGTTAIQNLRVHKYFKELGVKASSGLITHHPKSTLWDAEETLRILRQISHLDPFDGNILALLPGSPLYESLSYERKRALPPHLLNIMPEQLREYSASYWLDSSLEYKLSDELKAKWREVDAWCRNGQEQRRQEREILFTVSREADGSLLITDHRFGIRTMCLRGRAAKIYNACHFGLNIPMLEIELDEPRAFFEKDLAQLVEDQLMLFADGYYLSLALRPREELMARLDTTTSIGTQTRLKAMQAL